ncbi:hypothetical protein GCM10022225_63030 [Plantactinospora mayteni]|uniref:Tyr recombinase domain-containing protein n=1 Tax=Plantactinospora mayteni TaxID=566021 RepID=A0ABQ4EZ67_9ACTN|nr:hypothetical protein Pma05_65270 [Plantactinospora mayteni]
MSLPAVARTTLATHLRDHVRERPDALAFTGDKDAVLRSGNWRRAVDWSAALRTAGMPDGFHFHDLRHTGNNLAAATGASTRELMHRMLCAELYPVAERGPSFTPPRSGAARARQIPAPLSNFLTCRSASCRAASEVANRLAALSSAEGNR